MLNNPQVLTTQEAAAYLKINPQVLKKHLRQGNLPARKVGRQWRINKLALDLWLAPSLASTLTQLASWQSVFQLGDQIGQQAGLTDEQILEKVSSFRKNRAQTSQSRS